jgi:hypothetical protein
MTMGIGSIAITTWRGPGIQDAAPDVAIVSRPGYTGAALVIGAAKPVQLEIETVSVAADDAAEDVIVSAARALVGTVTTAEDHRGITTSDCAVLSAIAAQSQWSSLGWLVTIRWQLLIG